MKNFWDEVTKIKKEYDAGKPKQHRDYICSKLDGKKIALYGAGALGQEFYRCLSVLGYNVACFCDTFKTKTDESTSLPIISPTKLMDEQENVTVIISTSTYANEILENLLALGFSREAILMDEDMMVFFSTPYEDFEKHLNEYAWAYNLFHDELSKRIIIDKIKAHLLGLPMASCALPQYFEPDLFKLTNDEVFVDVGFFNGDTTEEFIRQVNGKYKHIYAFEPDMNNIEQATNLLHKDNITIIPKGLWDQEDVLRFSADHTAGKITDEGTIAVPVTSLDCFFANKPVNEFPTLIKMDTEGAEKQILLGCKNVIQISKPRLAVCTYHKAEDLYELPRIIKQFYGDYKLYLRHYTRLHFETVLYAL